MALSKKAKRIIIAVVAVLIALPVVAAIVVFIWLNSIVKWGVQTGGQQVLGVKTELQDVDISVIGQELTLKGLSVGNPEGFKSPTLVKLGNMHVSANVLALAKHEADVKDITIQDPEFTIEFVGTDNNVSTLMKRLQGESAGPAEQKPQPGAKGEELKLRVKHLLLTGVKVHLVGMGTDNTITLPKVEMNDIQDANGNAIPVSKVVTTVLANVTGTAALSDQLAKQAKMAQEQLQNLQKAGKGALDGATQSGQDALKGIKDGAGQIKGMFSK